MRIIIVIILALLIGCEETPHQLYYQYSPDSTYVIYNYYYFNINNEKPYDISGFKLATLRQRFSMDLPEIEAEYIESWPECKELNTMNIEYGNGRGSYNTKEIGSCQVSIRTYQVNRIVQCEYSFEDIKIKKGYITFSGVERIFEDGNYIRTLFQPGPVKIKSTEDGYIKEIVISDYFNVYESELVTWRFKPKLKLKLDHIEHHGIFKELKADNRVDGRESN